MQLRESTTSDFSLELKELVFCSSLGNFFRCELCIVRGLFLKNMVIFEILSLTSLKATQIIPFRRVEADILSTSLLYSDFSCTWLELTECKSVYASAGIPVWGLESFSFKFMCDQTSLYFVMVLSRGDLCCLRVASVVFNAYISLHVLLLWQFHIAGKYVEISSARERRLWHRQHAAHIVLLFGLEAVIGFFDDLIIIRVISEVLMARHHHILLLLQRAVMFLDGLECDLDLNW